jgi:hypothetical protein
MRSFGRSQDAYDRFCAAVEVPMTVLALLWLPVLVVPAVARYFARRFPQGFLPGYGDVPRYRALAPLTVGRWPGWLRMRAGAGQGQGRGSGSRGLAGAAGLGRRAENEATRRAVVGMMST